MYRSLLKGLRAITIPIFLLTATCAVKAQNVIDFDNLTGLNYLTQTAVPVASQLSNQFQSMLGVTFSSGNTYVAVVNLGVGHATSGINGITGTDGNGNWTNSPLFPIVAQFSSPGNPNIPATTDFVSLRGDLQGGGTSLTLRAYGVNGALLGSTSAADSGGTLLSLSIPGIQRVEFVGNGSTAVDDFKFNSVSAATPEPGTWALLAGIGVGSVSLLRRRRAR